MATLKCCKCEKPASTMRREALKTGAWEPCFKVLFKKAHLQYKAGADAVLNAEQALILEHEGILTCGEKIAMEKFKPGPALWYCKAHAPAKVETRA